MYDTQQRQYTSVNPINDDSRATHVIACFQRSRQYKYEPNAQDDDEDRSAEIEMMSPIYRHSIVTNAVGMARSASEGFLQPPNHELVVNLRHRWSRSCLRRSDCDAPRHQLQLRSVGDHCRDRGPAAGMAVQYRNSQNKNQVPARTHMVIGIGGRPSVFSEMGRYWSQRVQRLLEATLLGRTQDSRALRLMAKIQPVTGLSTGEAETLEI